MIPLGRIARPHGIRGEVRIRTHDGAAALDADRLPRTVHVRRADDTTQRLAVERARGVPGGYVLAKFAGIETRTDAETLRGAEILADRADLPPPGEDEWYVEDIIGLRAVSPGGEPLGAVRDAYFNGAHEVLIVDTPTGNVDVPFVDAHVGDVDLGRGTIVLLDLDALRP